MQPKITYHIGEFEDAISTALHAAKKQNLTARLFDKDPSLWPGDQQKIANRLGWIDLPDRMQPKFSGIDEFVSFAKNRYDDALVLGMGGASLCIKTIVEIYGVKKGFPRVGVLDLTYPKAVALAEKKLKSFKKTLFIVSSKSGSTIESKSFYNYFRFKIDSRDNFISITDPGTVLDDEKAFSRVFRNFEDVGGRFSILSYFGMLPAALGGIDIRALLERAAGARTRLAGNDEPLRLAVCLNQLRLRGLDKLTLVTSPKLMPFGYWLEQLIAESLGKDGKTIWPVMGEVLEEPPDYCGDRVFLHIAVKKDKTTTRHLKAIRRLGCPHIDIELENIEELAGLIYLCEVVTALTGSLMDVNPFDEPAVLRAKELTSEMLAGGKLAENPQIKEGKAGLYFSERIRARLNSVLAKKGKTETDLPQLSIRDAIAAYFKLLEKNEPVVLLPYCYEDKKLFTMWQGLREALVKQHRVSTVFGVGPRFQHSLNQSFYSGPVKGLFIIITLAPSRDLDVPGENFSFGRLQLAQAIGIMRSLEERGHKVIRLHLPERALANIGKYFL